MAIYHMSAKVVSRGQGQSAVAAAAYRSGDPLVDERTGELKSYELRSLRIIHKEILAPQNAPEWVRDRSRLWNEAERAEKRKDSQLAREIEVSLPYELTEQQREWLVKDFAREAFVRRGYAVDLAIHTPDRGDPRNHHAHLMITMRVLGPDGFAPTKDRSLNDTEQLDTWRKQWANLANRHLERHGHAVRIDHRSLKAQGIDREATIHVGYAAAEIAARGAQSDRMDELNGILERNGIRAELRATEEELAELRELAANENRKPRREPGRARESRTMLEGPTDDELKAQPEREKKYLEHLKFEHEQAEAVLAAAPRAKALDDRAKAYQEAKELEAEEGRKKKAEQDAADARDARNGDISSASARYSIAIGQTYDVRDPYASLAKAAGAESAMFHKTQEQLKADAAKELDPDKRQAIELNRKIQGCDYMAITNDRLANISETVTGRSNNIHAVKDRQQAAHYRAMAEALREERSTVLEKVQAKDAAEKEQAKIERAEGQAAEPGSSEPRSRRDSAAPYRTVMPAKAPELEPETQPTDQTKTKGERGGDGSAMPPAQKLNYRQNLSPEANAVRPGAEADRKDELRVIEKDGHDGGPLSAFLKREQPRTSEPLQEITMREILKDPKARGAYLRHELKMHEEAKAADKALERIGSDMEKTRTVKAEDLRSLTREQWDGMRTKGEAGLVQSVKEAKDRGSQDLGRQMGGPKPRPLEP